VLIALHLSLLIAGSVRADDSTWRAHAAQVHSKFTGRKGTLLELGDSITETMAFWTPLAYTHRNAPPALEKAIETVKSYQLPECWREWKGPEHGNKSGETTPWALDRIDGWLSKLNPEAALLLFGTNDLNALEVDQYSVNLRRLVQRCEANGTVVILTTIPPRHGLEKKAEQYASAARHLAAEMHLPMVDLHAEIMKRRPTDWDGALPQFSAFKEYEVPTLLARDGVHPSNPEKYQSNYSDEALRSCGYSLRNYLTVLQYADLIPILQTKPKPVQQLKPVASTAIPELHPPEQPWFAKAPPLPAATGDLIRVSNVEELERALAEVKPGGTISVAEGLYEIKGPLEIKTDRVTLRGATTNREKIILDAGNRGELLRITACSGVTIADLTVQNVQWNGIKINSETGVQKVTIHHCLLHNIWQRFIKGVKVPEKDRERMRPTGFRIQYCLFYNDHPKQYSDDPADTEQNYRGNYIGGIDTMYPRDWTISDNVFVGIHGRTGEGRGAVFLWHDVQNCIVARNVFIDCDAGICLGNAFRPPDVSIHCTDCIVRNNFVTQCSENGIFAAFTRHCKIVNNTVYEPVSKLSRLIRLAEVNDGMVVANNLVCGPAIQNQSASKITFVNNLEKDLTTALIDPGNGNLRLTALATDAIGRGVHDPSVLDDIDHHSRGATPDIGAHQLSHAR